MPPDALELFLQLAAESHIPITLCVGSALGIAIAYLLSRTFDIPFAGVSLILVGLLGIVLAMFFAGGRVLEFRGVDPSLISSCTTGDLTAWDAQAILNSILFLPFTLGVTLVARKTRMAVSTSVTLIVALETLQAVTNQGVCEVADLVHNFVGVAAGILLAKAVMLVRAPKNESSVTTDPDHAHTREH